MTFAKTALFLFALAITVSATYYGGACSPRMGEINHAPMAIDMTAGWWYVTCNARTVPFGEPVGLFYVVFESYIAAAGIDVIRVDSAVSLPWRSATGRRFAYGSESKIVLASTMPWGVLPIDMSFENSSIYGDADSWDIEASEPGRYAFSLKARNSENAYRMTHVNGTGCFDYLVTGMRDVYYQSTVGMEIASGSWVQTPFASTSLIGKSLKLPIAGTCHYDRQAALSLVNVYQWTWGQATFADSLPEEYSILEGAHFIFGGLYTDADLKVLANTHVGIKRRGGPLIEYDGLDQVNITAHASHTDAKSGISFYTKLCVDIKAEGIRFCATADVPEAVVNTEGGGVFPDSLFLESPATYRVSELDTSEKLGFGYIEVTTGKTSSSSS